MTAILFFVGMIAYILVGAFVVAGLYRVLNIDEIPTIVAMGVLIAWPLVGVCGIVVLVKTLLRIRRENKNDNF